MRIAELFVQIGAKGIDKTVSGLSEIRQTFGKITSTSLETKAAILGVMYGLEQLMSQSARTGTALTQFGNLTGQDTDKLQRWQYLALQSGEAAEQMTGDIVALQAAMAKMVTGQGVPAGMSAIANVLGKSFDPSRVRDTFYMMDKLREYAQKTKDTPDVANQLLASFSISPATIQAMRSSTVELEKIQKSRLYTANEQKRLNSVTIGFTNIADKFEHGFGKINAQFGPGMLKDLTKVTDSILKLVAAFGALNQKLHVVSGFSRIFDGWAEIFDVITESTKQFDKGLVPDLAKLSLVGNAVDIYQRSQAQQTHVTNNVTVHAPITGVKHPEEVGKHLERHLNNAFRTIPKGGQ